MNHRRSLSLVVASLTTLACSPTPEDLAPEEAVHQESALDDDLADKKEKTDRSWLKELEQKVPQEVKDIVGAASRVSSLVGQATAAWDTATTLGQVLTHTRQSPTMSPEFVALYQELNRLVGALAYQNSQNVRNNIDTDMTLVMGKVEEAAHAGQPLDKSIDLIAERALIYASKADALFQRLYTDRNPLPWNQLWKHHLPRPEVVGGFVYDWRAGYPALLLNTSLRLVIMAARNPNFPNDNSYDVELKRLADSIFDHWRRIWDGVKCARVSYHDVVSPKLASERFTRVGGKPRSWTGAPPAQEEITDVYCADTNTDAVLMHQVVGGSRLDSQHRQAADDVERRMREALHATQPGRETSEIMLKLINLRG